MCGLIGRISVGAARPAPMADWLRELRHRGPDAAAAVGWNTPETIVWDRDTDVSTLSNILGHLRLSIIDVSDAADQPFISSDGRYLIVFNGEIYNYVELKAELAAGGAQFLTSSDTEVLVQAWSVWGKACLERLEGMFAFLLLDRRENRLYVVRDPMGIKPLYVAESAEEVLFCSEIGILIERQGRHTYDRASAARILRWGSDEGASDTLVEGIRRLPEGTCISFDLATLVRRDEGRFFDLGEIKTEDWSFEEARQKLRDTFLGSVERHMRADVPISFSLSGGIDSSAIVCSAHALGLQKPRTYSYIPSDARISEAKWSELVIRHVGADAALIRPTHEDVVGNLPFVTRHQGEPFGTLSIFAQNEVYRRVAKDRIKVILNGQGADELLAGYTHYYQVLIGGALARGDFAHVMRLTQAMREGFGYGTKDLAKMLARSALPSVIKEGAARRYLDQKAPWLNHQALLDAGLPSLVDYGDRQHGRQALKNTLKHSIRNGLQALLRYDDRNSMSHSIESRVPFVIPAMARLCLSFPDEFLVSREGVTKYIFREAMRGIVPDAILDRRDKVPFAPDNQGWKQALADLAADLPDHPAISPMIDGRRLKQALAETAAGDGRYDFTMMWAATNMLMFDGSQRMSAAA
jgi:asparagine synthase (glutamine-hydrolysing)